MLAWEAGFPACGWRGLWRHPVTGTLGALACCLAWWLLRAGLYLGLEQ